MTNLIENIISDVECVEVLAYLSYMKGCDDQVIHNKLLYNHIMFARLVLLNNIHLILEVHKTKKIWLEKPELMDEFIKRYNLLKIKKL